MNFQTQLAGINYIATDIAIEHSNILGGTPDPHTNGYDRLWLKIARWEQSFATLSKTLKSQSHFNDMIFEQERFSPNAHAAKQRHASKQANVGKLSAALATLEDNLRGLILTFVDGNGPIAKAIDALGHVMENWQQRAKSTEDGLLGEAPAEAGYIIQELQSEVPTPAPVLTNVPDITLVVGALLVLSREVVSRLLKRRDPPAT